MTLFDPGLAFHVRFKLDTRVTQLLLKDLAVDPQERSHSVTVKPRQILSNSDPVMT